MVLVLTTYSLDSEKPIITPPRLSAPLVRPFTQWARPLVSGARPSTFWYTRSTNWPLFSEP